MTQLSSVATAAAILARAGTLSPSEFAIAVAALANVGRKPEQNMSPRKRRAARRAAKLVGKATNNDIPISTDVPSGAFVGVPVAAMVSPELSGSMGSDPVVEMPTGTNIPSAEEVSALIDPGSADVVTQAPLGAFFTITDGPVAMSKTDMLATFKPDGIVCLLDNKVVKDLGRHARKHFGVNAVEYRAQFGLPETYPMTLEQVAKFVAAQ